MTQASQQTSNSLDRRLLVLCADDNVDITNMLRIAINREPDMWCVACVNDTAMIFEELKKLQPRPHIIVVDLTMPLASPPPLAAISELAVLYPECRAIVFSGHDGQQVMDEAADAGAWGCVSKNADPQTILTAIRSVAAGQLYFM